RNGDHGIDVHNAVDAHVVANTVFANSDSGIESTTSTRTYLANNISVDNGINSTRSAGNIRIDSASASTAILNDDLVFLRVAGTMVDWAGTKYTSMAAFRTATGKETRGIEADPRFRASATADFHLTAGSPAIDAADAGAGGQPATDFDGLARFDDPATANAGVGQISYADRGAFEFQG
ncbi:MAG: choice-of-anchor Q domain-containing protein, partial [Acidimicrobiia bacterium]